MTYSQIRASARQSRNRLKRGATLAALFLAFCLITSPAMADPTGAAAAAGSVATAAAAIAGMGVRQLREQAGKIHNRMQELRTQSRDTDAPWSGEDETTWRQLDADYTAVEKRITEDESRETRFAEIESRFAGSMGDTRIGGNHTSDRPDSGRQSGPTPQQRLLAMQGWMRSGEDEGPSESQVEAARMCGVNLNSRGMTVNMAPSEHVGGRNRMWTGRGGSPVCRNRFDAEARDMSVGTDADGGFSVPEGFLARYEETLLAFGSVRGVCDVIRTTQGNDLPVPHVDDTANTGEILGENTDMGASVDPTLSVNTLGAFKYSSKPVMISHELLMDSAFNFGQRLPVMLATRIGRIHGAHTTTGTGSGQPQGMATGSTLGVTAASTTVITWEELVNLQHSVDPAYRAYRDECGFMFHDDVLRDLKKLSDDQNRPLWVESLSKGEPNAFMNWNYAVNQSMAQPTTGNIAVLAGRLTAYTIRDAGTLRIVRLNERFAEKDQVAFVAFTRSDGRVMDADAIQHLIMA